jgi:hypothetical protein
VVDTVEHVRPKKVRIAVAMSSGCLQQERERAHHTVVSGEGDLTVAQWQYDQRWLQEGATIVQADFSSCTLHTGRARPQPQWWSLRLRAADQSSSLGDTLLAVLRATRAAESSGAFALRGDIVIKDQQVVAVKPRPELLA